MEEKLKALQSYLRSLGRRPVTVRNYVCNSRRFLEWLSKEGLTLDQTSYSEILKWIGWQQGKGQSTHFINQQLHSIRQLYASLNIENPIEELRLRGQRHKVVSDLLSLEDLEKLYADYGIGGLVGKRNKAILGMLIWQGLKRREVLSLRVEDLDLENALLRVPSSAMSNERVLSLDGRQLLDLQDYVQLIRKELNSQKSERLYVGGGKDMLVVLNRHLRKYNARVQSPGQIRQSIITHWLKQYDIRRVQYMAGHRYVSSTSRYQTRDLDKLQERIEQFHPLNS